LPLAALTAGLLDRARDRVVGHRLLARRLDRHGQAWVHVRIRRAELGRHGDLAHQLGGDLRALVGVDLTLLVQPLTTHDGELYRAPAGSPLPAVYLARARRAASSSAWPPSKRTSSGSQPAARRRASPCSWATRSRVVSLWPSTKVQRTRRA